MNDSITTLLCQENQTRLEGEFGDEDYSFIPLQDYGVSEDEFMAILIEREISLGFKKDESLVFENWIKRSRMDAINWILKNDKYWAIRLLSVACLSLAAKMEECHVPLLSEFQLEDYCFENKVIQRMELSVLSTLEWNMAIITPLAFLPYFITKLCNEPPPSHFLSKTMQLIFTLMKEVNLMDHRPSTIAAAATLVALDQQLTIEAVELYMSSFHQYRFLDPKEIFACYNLILRLYTEKTRRDKLVHSSSPSPIQSMPIGTIESTLVTSVAMTKRRRLTFNDDKESCDGKKLH